jgi:hypothetical protein
LLTCIYHLKTFLLPGSCRERKLAEAWKPLVRLSSTGSAANAPWPAAARNALRFNIKSLGLRV